jgi:hypothetical protein
VRSTLLRFVLIGLLSVGACGGNAGRLVVGECFDPPGTDADVTNVERRACSEPHGAEVVFVGTYEPANAPYPTNDEFFAFVNDRCIPAFNEYTGLAYDSATELDLGVLTPTSDGWAKADRRIICYAVRVDKTALTESVRKAP